MGVGMTIDHAHHSSRYIMTTRTHCNPWGVPLKESRRQDVALVKNEANLLALNADPPHDRSQVLVEVLQGVAVARFHLQFPPNRFGGHVDQ